MCIEGSLLMEMKGPDKQEFLKNAINSYIDELVRTRVVSNV